MSAYNELQWRPSDFVETNITWDVYRRFFEESGIKREVTQILHKIWEEPEKPPYLDQISYVRKNFAGGRINVPNCCLIQQDLVWKKKIVKQMRKRNEKLRSILILYEQLECDRKGEDEKGEEGDIDELKRFFAQNSSGDGDNSEEKSTSINSIN